MKIKNKLNLDQEIVLSCAFRYALGRMTYVVSSVCSELKNNYHALSENTKQRISKEIQEYQNEHGLAGMDFDNDEWNKIKWLFDKKNHEVREANYHNTDKWDVVESVKGEDGEYYSIPHMLRYGITRESCLNRL